MSPTPQIPGLNYIPDFISDIQSENLLKIIDEHKWRTDLKRCVQHYGYRYDYRARLVSPQMNLGSLPGWLQKIGAQLVEQNLFTKMPDQVIVNEYEAGQGISAHIDCVPCFGNSIASLSLGSATEMRFQRADEKHDLRLLPKSLMVLNGEARSEWRHGIAARKNDWVDGKKVARSRRVSLTFRTVRLSS
ncbi:MAG: alpha-ketoglutarate-dependent dioxygenase AlkB [Pseudomonadota bacterium]